MKRISLILAGLFALGMAIGSLSGCLQGVKAQSVSGCSVFVQTPYTQTLLIQNPPSGITPGVFEFYTTKGEAVLGMLKLSQPGSADYYAILDIPAVAIPATGTTIADVDTGGASPIQLGCPAIMPIQ